MTEVQTPTMPSVIDSATHTFPVKPEECRSTHGLAGLPPMLCTKDGPVCAYCGTPVVITEK